MRDLTNIVMAGTEDETLEALCADCAPRIYGDVDGVELSPVYTWENHESDYPQHCQYCDVLLEWDMTEDGLEYIRTEVLDALNGDALALAEDSPVYEWHRAYGEYVAEYLVQDGGRPSLSDVLDVEDMTRAYLTAQLWSGQADIWTATLEFGGEPLDTVEIDSVWSGSIDDLPADIRQQAREDVQAFIDAIEPYLFYFDLVPYPANTAVTAEQLGHDFSLTRNHHGAGFWDRGWSDLGTWLTNWAQSFGGSVLTADMVQDVPESIRFYMEG